MTVILVGRTPNGNLLVTDAMASVNAKSNSFRDYGLTDKMSFLTIANCYCSLVANSDDLLNGIVLLDGWQMYGNWVSDFSEIGIMQKALIATEKYVELRNLDGCKRISNYEAEIYFVSWDKVFEYEITCRRNKFSIKKFRFFEKNEVLINYGGRIEHIPNFTYPNNQLYIKAKKQIETVHTKRKEAHKSDSRVFCLDYDFDGRFSGVVYPNNKKERERIYAPFNKLSEFIASNASSPKLIWDLIENDKFSWNPEFEGVSKAPRK